MITRITADAAAFRELVFPFLQADPVLNTRHLSTISDLAGGRFPTPEPPTFLSVHDATGEVVGVVVTTHLGIFLGALPEELVPAVVAAQLEATPGAGGVQGLTGSAVRFAELFAGSRSYRQVEAGRLHKLETFVPQSAPGEARLADPGEVEVLAGLLGRYGDEIDHHPAGDDWTEWVRGRVELGRLWVWVDGGELVGVAGNQTPVFGVARIGPVYTPPEFRGRGYASALTAHLTSVLLAGGNQVCLNTDLANPTSNKIYHAIGYRPVADFATYAFE